MARHIGPAAHKEHEVYIRPDGRRDCRTCARETLRRWRLTHPGQPYTEAKAAGIARWRQANPQAVAAKRLAYDAKRRGDLMPEPCKACGAEPAEAHHEDYNKPLEVRWLCRLHHRERHMEIKRRLTAVTVSL